MAESFHRGTGRRKNAVARVRIQPGEGRITVNEKDPLAYLGRRVLEMAALAPLRVTGTQRKFDISIKVIGGGTSGQAGAIAHGIARALIRYDADLRAVLKKAGLTLEQMDIVELNEAFAAQVLAVLKELPIDPERLNVNGGAIALGHPLGCTGAKLTTSLLYEMKRRDAHRGLAALCLGGGNAVAMAVER